MNARKTKKQDIYTRAAKRLFGPAASWETLSAEQRQEVEAEVSAVLEPLDDE